jgi:hypothetical protein
MPAIIELQRIGVPCVNFFCDNVREFRQVPREYHAFTLHWVPEPQALPIYRRAGLPHLCAPMPCWVPSRLRTPPALETEPPTFIGTADILRRDLFGRALQSGADLVVRGRGWTPGAEADPRATRSVGQMIRNQVATVRDGGVQAVFHKVESRLWPIKPPPIPSSRFADAPLGEDEYFKATREAVVALGVNRVPTAKASDRRPLVYSRLRDIEAPMLGACYLTEWSEGIDTLYAVGEEVEIYRTPGELAEKLSELMANRARRMLMRERAQKRALREHSVGRSLARISARLGLTSRS